MMWTAFCESESEWIHSRRNSLKYLKYEVSMTSFFRYCDEMEPSWF